MQVVITFQTIMSKAWYELEEDEIQTLNRLHQAALERSNVRKVLEAYERLQQAWKLMPDDAERLRDEVGHGLTTLHFDLMAGLMECCLLS